MCLHQDFHVRRFFRANLFHICAPDSCFRTFALFQATKHCKQTTDQATNFVRQLTKHPSLQVLSIPHDIRGVNEDHLVSSQIWSWFSILRTYISNVLQPRFSFISFFNEDHVKVNFCKFILNVFFSFSRTFFVPLIAFFMAGDDHCKS